MLVWSELPDRASQIRWLLMLAVFSAVLWWTEPEAELGGAVRISLNKLAFLFFLCYHQ